jgi:hypothetical protein
MGGDTSPGIDVERTHDTLVGVSHGQPVEVVECPHCQRQAPASPGRYVCSGCSEWFTVAEVEP